MHKNSAVKKIDINILTSNTCLENGLRSISDELNDEVYSSIAQNGIHSLKLIIIDIDHVVLQKQNWKSTSLAIADADIYLFMSLSDWAVCGVPFLAMHGPMIKIKQDLLCFLKYRSRERRPLGQSSVLSSLSKSELNLFIYMGYGLSLNEIYDRMNISMKALYSVRSKAMKKLKLRSTKEMSSMLSFIEFLAFHENMHAKKHDRSMKANGVHYIAERGLSEKNSKLKYVIPF